MSDQNNLNASRELVNLVEVMVKALVDSPREVQVKEVQGETTTVIEVRVAKFDFGKVIGKQGNTAKALRQILGGASAKLKRRTVLEVVETP